ncbi:MAG: Uncharacterised protein [Marine Group II euryarchaeote MED-G33]|nr:MAG: Uncharacterised protein [Marine Group II euryarchaeote MED-G33]
MSYCPARLIAYLISAARTRRERLRKRVRCPLEPEFANRCKNVEGGHVSKVMLTLSPVVVILKSSETSVTLRPSSTIFEARTISDKSTSCGDAFTPIFSASSRISSSSTFIVIRISLISSRRFGFPFHLWNLTLRTSSCTPGVTCKLFDSVLRIFFKSSINPSGAMEPM